MAFEKLNLFGDEGSAAPPKKATSMNKMVELTGTVNAVFFESPTSLFKVVLIDVVDQDFDWKEPQIVVTGNMAEVQEGAKYQFKGKLVEHPKYGTQIQLSQASRLGPDTKEGLVEYFAGSQFKGIGKKTAEKIVKQLGMDAIDVIKDNAQVLRDIGLSNAQADVIETVLAESNGMEKILIKLADLGISGKTADNVIAKYREDTLKIIEENPYQLANDIENIGFKRVDAIGQQLNFPVDFPGRLQSGILATIQEWCNSTGDTYMVAEVMLQRAQQLLGNEINAEKIAEQVLELGKQGRVVGENGQIYLKWLYQAEEAIGYQLQHLLKNPPKVNEKAVDRAIKRAEEHLALEYDETQNNAIRMALSHGITIITGGPGTGKTTIVKGLINSFAELHDLDLDPNANPDQDYPIQLAAPTGRAAKRLSEVTGVPAKTIHRLLGLNGNDDLHDEQIQELRGELLVVDEMSMVDTGLFNTLISAINAEMQVVLVGDKDQLPSVGPGQVFSDLIRSQKIPTISLTKIYRQEQDSSIIQMAHSIQNGEMPDDFTQNRPDKSFIKASAYQVADAIDQIAERAVARGLSKNDLQVLAPMYRGAAGIDEINRHLQRVLNPPQTDHPKYLEANHQQFRIGDKVLQLVNAPENNIFNGDIGEITGIVTEKAGKGHAQLIVDYDGNEVTYGKNDLNQLTLAYCVSIHKSQGSEFPVVILPMVRQYYRMLQRNLLYTGLTRASDSIILLGEVEAYQRAVQNESANRQTGLVKRLNPEIAITEKPIAEKSEPKTTSEKSEAGEPQRKSILRKPEVTETFAPSGDEPTLLTKQLVETGKIDPMIGMDGVTPRDFL